MLPNGLHLDTPADYTPRELQRFKEWELEARLRFYTPGAVSGDKKAQNTVILVRAELSRRARQQAKSRVA